MPVDDRERLEALFVNHIDVGLHHGAQLAVYVDGEEAVTLAGGTTGPDGDGMTTGDRMVFFSCTKPLTGVAIHQLVEAGGLGYDDRIVEHWPAFADEGTEKEDVTVRHVLSHQGGFPVGPFDAQPDAWSDWDAAVDAMEAIDLQFAPGETAAYHPMNYGWVLGELIRRVDGRMPGVYVREAVCEPIGMTDTYLGLPEDVPDDVATLVAFDEFDRARDPGRGLEGDNEAAAANFNREAAHRAAIPAASAVGTARDLARFYACLAGGGAIDGDRLLAPETVERATTLEAAVEEDPIVGVPRRYGLGFGLAGTAVDSYGTLAPEGTFGHGGLGSCISWADPDAGLGVAYLTNGVRNSYEHHARVNAIGDAVRRTFSSA